MTPQDLVEHVLLERRAEEAEARLAALLDMQALVDRGDAIAGLTVAASAGQEVTLRCPPSISRIRPGDRLELANDGRRVRASLLDMRDHGRELVVRAPSGALSGEASWTARLQPTDLSSIILQALSKLQPGAPGWGFFRLLATDGAPWHREAGPEAEAILLLDQIQEDTGLGLDENQREVFLRCLRQPPALAVQGPPGTGKTMLLAYLAEALARRGQRVLVVAPTHQAVNNALSTIHSLFPGRSVLKVGDALRREALDEGVSIGLLGESTKGGLKLAHETITGMTFLAALSQLVVRGATLTPNVVIIDEAGQLPLSQGAATGLLGAGSVLMFGDDMQMPPVFSGEIAADPRSVSVFGRFRSQHPDLVPMLEVTYRLNDVLSGVIGDTFYGGRLRPSPRAAPRRLDPACAAAAERPAVARILAPEVPLVWVRHHTPSCTQLNVPEASIIAEVVATAMAGGLEPDRVAVVTPFRRQAMMIRNHLQARVGIGDRLPIVDTVERVQGLTVDLVAISACATDPEYVSSLASFLLSPNRLNVAASRARTKVVLAADPVVLREIPIEYDALLAQRAWREVVGRAGVVVEV